MFLKTGKKYNNSVFPIVLSGILWMVFIGFHFFVRQHNYMDSPSSFVLLTEVLSAVGCAMFYYWIYSDWIKRDLSMLEMKEMLALTLIVVAVFTILEIFQIKEWTAMFGSDKIALGTFTFSKDWLFGFLCIICFPSVLILLRSALREDNIDNRICAAIIIVVFSLVGFVLYVGNLNVCLFEMALLNVISVSDFVWSMSGKQRKRRRMGNVIATIFIYLIFWLGLLFLLRKPGQDLVSYMYGSDTGWEQRSIMVSKLVSGAAAFGHSILLEEMDMIDFMQNHLNVIHNLLYYGGWSSVIIYMILLAVFLRIMYLFLSPKLKEYKSVYWIYQAAFVNLVFRAVVGAIYSFGIAPFPVALPFAGSTGWILDSICTALLIYSEIENRRIRPVLDVYFGIQCLHLSKVLEKYTEDSEYSLECLDYDTNSSFMLYGLKSLSLTEEVVTVIPVFEWSLEERRFVICSMEEKPYKEIVVLEKVAVLTDEGASGDVKYIEVNEKIATQMEDRYKSAILLSLEGRSILDSAQFILRDASW